MLREPDLRRPEFAGGTRLLLPDGQAWTFFNLRHVDGPRWDWGDVTAEENVALTDTLYRTLERLTAAIDARERAAQVLALAFLLLARNYELDFERFNSIMTAGPITDGLWARLEMLAKAIEWATVDAVLTEVANG